jgi:hypothetical protein
MTTAKGGRWSIAAISAGSVLLLVAVSWMRGGGPERPGRISREEERLQSEISDVSKFPGAVFSVADHEGKRTAITGDEAAYLHAAIARWREADLGDDVTRGRLSREWLAALSDENVGAMVRGLSADELDTTLGLTALDRWLRADASDALAWVRVRTRLSAGETLAVARCLLEEPKRLEAFCDALTDVDWGPDFISAAGLEAAEKNPAQALALAGRLEEGDARTNLLETIAYAWMSREPAGAAAWVLTTKDPATRARLIGVSAKAIAITDPDLAAQWLEKAGAGRREFSDTAICVVGLWAGRDPREAGRWVERFPAGAARDAAIDLLADHWLQADAAAANAWLGRLPERARVLERIARARTERAMEATED